MTLASRVIIDSELDERAAHGLLVTLILRKETIAGASIESLVLRLVDEDGTCEMIVEPAKAWDAFHHPYAYIDSAPRAA